VSSTFVHAKVHARGKGASAIATAAYRSGTEIADAAYGVIRDYSKKERVVAQGIAHPAGAPKWARERKSLWDAVERGEKSKKARLSRELIIALPHELSDEARIRIAKRIANQFAKMGMVVDWAVHGPGKNNGLNDHLHLNMTTRPLFKDPKTHEWRWGAKHHVQKEKPKERRRNKDGSLRKERPKREYATEDLLYHEWNKSSWLEKTAKREIIQAQINREIFTERGLGRAKGAEYINFDEAKTKAAARGGPRVRLNMPQYRRQKKRKIHAERKKEYKAAVAEQDLAKAELVVAEREFELASWGDEWYRWFHDHLAALKQQPTTDRFVELANAYGEVSRQAEEQMKGENSGRTPEHLEIRKYLDDWVPELDNTRRDLARIAPKFGFVAEAGGFRPETEEERKDREAALAAARIERGARRGSRGQGHGSSGIER